MQCTVKYSTPLVRVKVVIIPEDVVVAGPGGALDTYRIVDNISIVEMVVISHYLLP